MNHGLFLTAAIAIASLTGCGGSQPPIGAPGAMAQTSSNVAPNKKTFQYTGQEQSFKVPPDVTWIAVVAHGAAGARVGSYGSTSGLGGRVYAVIRVHPRETLHIFVGGAGYVNSEGSMGGGFNGGGNGGRFPSFGYGGGGASDVRQGGDRLRDRVVVAGGGGGQGGFECCGGSGGAGGGSIGGSGGGGDNGGGEGGGGRGGTQRRGGPGGKAGQGSYNGQPGSAGSRGDGGNGGEGGLGGTSSSGGGAGGGGGGGYYGGGGGGGGNGTYSDGTAGGGGGGGSSYVEPSARKFRTWRGWKNAANNGLVVFSW